MALFDEEPESLDQAVNIAVGAASVAWENPGGAGIFDTDRAKEVAEELTAWIKANYVPTTTRVDGAIDNPERLGDL